MTRTNDDGMLKVSAEVPQIFHDLRDACDGREDIKKVAIAVQSRVTYSDIEDMTLEEAKRHAATAPKRHVKQGVLRR